MKREYSKPFLAVESFQLDAMIAVSCSSENKTVIGKDPLNYVDEVTLYFADGPSGGICSFDVAGTDIDGDDGYYCYQGPSYAISDSYMNS